MVTKAEKHSLYDLLIKFVNFACKKFIHIVFKLANLNNNYLFTISEDLPGRAANFNGK